LCGTEINSIAQVEPALFWPGNLGTGLVCSYLQCGKKKNSHILTLKFSLHPVSQYINFNSDIGSTVNSSYVMSKEPLWFDVRRSRLLLLPLVKIGFSFICGNLRGEVFLEAGKEVLLHLWSLCPG
jgi:hypothetical protein